MRSYPFKDLSRAQLVNVLDMLAGRYPSDDFAQAPSTDRLGPAAERTIRARDQEPSAWP